MDGPPAKLISGTVNGQLFLQHGHTCGLVDHDEIAILVNHGRCDEVA